MSTSLGRHVLACWKLFPLHLSARGQFWANSHSGPDSCAIWSSVSVLQLVLLLLHRFGSVSAKQPDSHTFCSTILLLMHSTCLSAGPWGFVCFLKHCSNMQYHAFLICISDVKYNSNTTQNAQTEQGIIERKTYTDKLGPLVHGIRVPMGHEPRSPQDRSAVDKTQVTWSVSKLINK